MGTVTSHNWIQTTETRVPQRLSAVTNPVFASTMEFSTVVVRGVGRNLLMGGQAGDLEDGTPQWGPAAERRWGSGTKSPETGDKCTCRLRIFCTILACYCQSIDQQNIFGRRRAGDMHPCPPPLLWLRP